MHEWHRQVIHPVHHLSGGVRDELRDFTNCNRLPLELHHVSLGGLRRRDNGSVILPGLSM